MFGAKLRGGAGIALIYAGFAQIACAAEPPPRGPPSPPPPSYADLVDLAESGSQIVQAEVRKIITLLPEQIGGVRAGWGRFYIESRTKALLFGSAPLGESLRYLADLPLDSQGKPPKLKKLQVLLFADPVARRAGELRLTAPDAQIAWTAETEARLRSILGELHRDGATPKVTGVREAFHVAGTLRGTGESQFFLNTVNDTAAAITVTRAAEGASWGVSFSEVASDGQMRPARDTLAWYRLACFLPPYLPGKTNLSQSDAEKRQAEADYRYAMQQLGPCPRTRK